MPHIDHTGFVNSCRDERGVSHHTLRAYAQDLRTFARFTKAHHLIRFVRFQSDWVSALIHSTNG